MAAPRAGLPRRRGGLRGRDHKSRGDGRRDPSTQTGEVGIYLAAFAEVENLFVAAADSELGELRCYGSNSVALSRELIENDTAAAFAIETGYPNPILGLREADRAAWGPVSEASPRTSVAAPTPSRSAAYDALAAAHQAAVNAGGGEDVSAVKAELVTVTDETTGLTGPLSLNEAGDRALPPSTSGPSASVDNGDFTWSRVATYSAGGTAERLPASC